MAGSYDVISAPVACLEGNGARLVRRVALDGEAIGGLFEEQEVRYCVLGNLLPPDLSASRSRQARSVFEKMEAALLVAGMDMSDVVRTWFFLDRILDWYDEFNAVRTRFFQERDLFARVLPASTGVGAPNAAGAALVAGAVAMQSGNGPIDLREVPSPLQCPATGYRSSFSRAVEIRARGRRWLYVSGTASIAPDGRTAHAGDVEQQIALTMTVVESILRSRRMSWSDATRAVAYFKDIENLPLLTWYCQKYLLSPLPLSVSAADICRPDLLFEVELDAVGFSTGVPSPPATGTS